jgi:hypothetical protein
LREASAIAAELMRRNRDCIPDIAPQQGLKIQYTVQIVGA